MNNYNNSVRNNQAFSQESLNILYRFNISIEDPFEKELGSRIFSPERMSILKCVLRYMGIFNTAYISHETISRFAGCCRDTVIEAMKVFEEYEILKVIYRHRKTSVYSLGKFLLNKRIIWLLKDVVPNLYWAFSRIALRGKENLGLVVNDLLSLFKSEKTSPTPIPSEYIFFLKEKEKYRLMQEKQEKEEEKMEQASRDPDMMDLFKGLFAHL